MKKPCLLLPVLLGALLCGFSGSALAQRGGRAAPNNCIIKPKFDRPEFERPTFDRPGFERPRPERVQFVRATIERTEILHASFERSEVLRPTFVTCSGDASSKKVLQRRTLAAVPAGGPEVARYGLMDRSPAPVPAQVAVVEDCCGGRASQPVR